MNAAVQTGTLETNIPARLDRLAWSASTGWWWWGSSARVSIGKISGREAADRGRGGEGDLEAAGEHAEERRAPRPEGVDEVDALQEADWERRHRERTERRATPLRGSRRYRPGPGSSLYSPGMLGTSLRSREPPRPIWTARSALTQGGLGRIGWGWARV